MVDLNLIHSLGNYDSDVDTAVFDALGEAGNDLDKLVKGDEVQDFTPGAIIKGRISGSVGDDFIVELGLKSEGILENGEFDEPAAVKVGDVVQVLLEDVEGDTGLVKISKRKADRIINWEAIMKSKKEGDPVKGKGHQEDQGRPAGGHRRARLPPRLARWTSAGRAKSAIGSAATSTR